MAEPIIVWKATDGSQWKDEEAARKRDALCADVAEALLPLGAKPDGTDFANGGGFVQHTEAQVRRVRRELYSIANVKGILKWWFDSQREDHAQTEEALKMGIHPSWYRRMLDGAHAPLDRAYGRLNCIDGQFREWGQPYYADHPDEAKQVCLNAEG
jgi:hypothetical protein